MPRAELLSTVGFGGNFREVHGDDESMVIRDRCEPPASIVGEIDFGDGRFALTFMRAKNGSKSMWRRISKGSQRDAVLRPSQHSTPSL